MDHFLHAIVRHWVFYKVKHLRWACPFLLTGLNNLGRNFKIILNFIGQPTQFRNSSIGPDICPWQGNCMNERNCFVKKGGQGRALVGGGFHNLKPVFLTVIISSLYKMCLSCTQNVSFLTYRFCPIMAISYCAKFCNGPYNHMFQSILEVLFEKSHFNPQFFTFFINLFINWAKVKGENRKVVNYNDKS